MTLDQYIKTLQAVREAFPELGKATVITSSDEEGNSFSCSILGCTAGVWNEQTKEFKMYENYQTGTLIMNQKIEESDVPAICVN